MALAIRTASLLYVLGLIISVCTSTADAGELDERLEEYRAWLRTNGLSAVFEIKQAPTYEDKQLALTLHSGHLEDAHRGLDASNYRKLEDLTPVYLKLYFKLVNLSGLPADRVKLRIRGRSGYCNVWVVDKTVGVMNGHLQVKEEVIPPTSRRLCSLNFSYIAKLESELQAGLSQARQSLAFGRPHPIETPDRLSLLKLKDFFERQYKKKKGQITFTNISDDLLTFVVRKLRGEIIADGKFWEKLQVVVVSYRPEPELVKLVLILDGQYASGLNPPAVQAYSDLEPKYTSSLREYGEKLLVAVKGVLGL